MKKRISFLLAAVMLAITPAGTALGSESDTDVILSEDLMISDETLAADEGESESLSGGDAALIDVIEVQGEDTENETENETEADTGAALVDETGAAEEDVLIVGIEEADAADIPAEISEAAESEASEILDEAAAVDDTVTAVSDLTPEATNNTGDQNYSVWSSPVYSYLETVSGGFMRVEYTGSVVVVEYYNSSFTLTSKKYVTRELTYFGGFYAGSDAYYLVFGQSNTDEDDSAEVVRVVKYSTDWVRQGAASLYGANTTYPFDAGSLRMAESGGYLYIRTSHEMYTSSDGLNHQANLMIEVDESSMTVTDSYSAVMNNSVGYVSHSFNQFILVDDSNNLIAVDHGDAYPRAAILFRYSKQAGINTFSGSTSSVKLLSFQGATGNNATGASLGGLEYSSSSYLVAGNSVTQDSNWSSHTARNIFVTVTSRSSLSSTSVKWITDYDTDGSISASTPQLVKLGSDSFLLLWTTTEYTISGNTGSKQSKLHYVYLDGQGNTTSEIYTVNGQLSDCKPIVSGGSVYWYVTGDAGSTYSSTTPYFYTIRSDGSFSVKVSLEAPSFTAVPVADGIEISWNAVSGASGYYVRLSNLSGITTKTVSDGSVTSATISASSDTTYMIWVEAYSGSVKSLAADKLEFYYLAAPSVTLSNTDDAIRVSWQSVTGAEGYRVYRKTGSGSYTLVKTTTELSFTDSDLTGGSSYTYQVYAYSDSGTSGGSTEKTAVYVAAPVLQSVSIANGGVQVTWETATGATSYRVYYKRSSNSSYSSQTYTAGSGSTQSAVLGVSSGYTYDVYVKAYIDSTGGKASSTLSVEYLAAPVISSLSSTSSGICVTWGTVSGASGYKVYRKTGSGSYTLVKTTTGLSFTDSGLTGGNSYTYQVYAYSDNGASNGSTERTAVYVPTPTLKSVSIANSGVQVTWGTVTGATSYRVYYKRSSNSSYSSQTYTAGSGSTQSEVLSVSSGYTYDIYVKAYIDSTGGAASSSLSIIYLSAPVISSLSSTSSGICVTWGTVSGASGYKVYRKTGSGSYSLVKTTTGTSFTDSGLTGGNSYTYQVYAYSGSWTSNGSTEKTAVYVPTPALKSVSNVNGGVQVTWGTVTGATLYRVYYKRSSDSSYWYQTFTAESGSTQNATLSVSSGYTYDIYVKAYIDSTGGAASSTLSIVYLAAPTISSLSSASSGICVTWGTVSGASGYKVYRKTGSGSYSLVKTTTGTSFTDSGLTGGNSYTYQVYAYSGSGTSSGSTEKTAVYVPAPALKNV
ncbi:MAG: hypothetical protein LUD18_02645, partial [Lachnospiraceae bacterium]|nr:hypothetical protein [Lachnospiraceae bacterium]